MAQKTDALSGDVLSPAVAPGFDARFIADLGAKAAEAQLITIDTTHLQDVGLPPAVPVIWDPNRKEVIGLKSSVDAWRLTPAAKKGTATALTLATFIELVNRHKTVASAVFADTDWHKPSFTAVIDYHPAISCGQADNGKHRVHYAFPLSEEWKAWVKLDGEVMSQLDFATFLEDRVAELASPTEAEKIALERDFATTVATPAELVQLSRGLQVNIESRVKNAHTLQNGTGQIQWEENHQDATGKPLVVPGIFILSIAPFFMGEKIRVPVRLRYRVSGTVKWFFQIYRPDQFVTERVRDDLDHTAAETGLPAYEGAPEMAA